MSRVVSAALSATVHLIIKGEPLGDVKAALLEAHHAQAVPQEDALVAIVVDVNASAHVHEAEVEQCARDVQVGHASDESARVDERVKRGRPVGHRT